jgi:Na+/melibiose symporter-like transporter
MRAVIRKVVVGTALAITGALCLSVLAGILLALAGGIGGHQDWLKLGGAMILLGIMPLLWLLFSDIGQVLSELLMLGQRSKTSDKPEDDELARMQEPAGPES